MSRTQDQVVGRSITVKLFNSQSFCILYLKNQTFTTNLNFVPLVMDWHEGCWNTIASRVLTLPDSNILIVV